MTEIMRVCARIDMAAIRHNAAVCINHVADKTGIYVVVKADGYGHGALNIALELEQNDRIIGFCVATYNEAMELVGGGIKKPILILGYTFPDVYESIVKNDIRPTIISYEMARDYNDIALKCGKILPVHLKIDTGMGRIGFLPNEDGYSAIEEISKLPNIFIEGIFTHFARADEADKRATDEQYDIFKNFVGALAAADVCDPPIRHFSNSAAILSYPNAVCDAARAGIAIYGLYPSSEVGSGYDLRPALSLYSHIVHVKTVSADTPISYGGTYITGRKSVIATIPVGYADGYPRSLSNKGEVLIRGRRARICGRVCMDQFMIDVTDIPDVKVGDKVTLLGADGNDSISAEELGDLSGRFNYELVCDLNKRIPRIYDNGTV